MIKYGLSVFCVVVLMGCNSSSEPSSVNEINGVIITEDEDVNKAIEDDVIINVEEGNLDTEEELIDYNLITCEDSLTDVLSLINEYRSQSQVCGTTTFPAVDALVWNNLLTLSAAQHANDMANYDFFSHEGSDGSSVGTRVSSQGYSWNYVAENIAAGYFSAEAVVEGWMNSEGHCRNMMNENVTQVGLACTYNDDTTYKTYWVQNFARPSN